MSHGSCNPLQVQYRDNFYSSWEDAEPVITADGAKTQPTMFPSDATRALPLERAMRFLPHAQDTGGFFVAVIEKVGECADMAIPRFVPRPKPAKVATAAAAPRVRGAPSLCRVCARHASVCVCAPDAASTRNGGSAVN
jgi:hypothetical protein